MAYSYSWMASYVQINRQPKNYTCYCCYGHHIYVIHCLPPIIITEKARKIVAITKPKIILRIKTWLLSEPVKNGAITPAENQATEVVVKKFATSFIWFWSKSFTK